MIALTINEHFLIFFTLYNNLIIKKLYNYNPNVTYTSLITRVAIIVPLLHVQILVTTSGRLTVELELKRLRIVK